MCPESGSAEFAFAYIPSEAVNYFLETEALEMLRGYVKKGVIVMSPLTLTSRIELIKAGVHAKKLSKDAKKVSNSLSRLSIRFKNIDNAWSVLYDTHIHNLKGKAEELDRDYKRLREEFDTISKLSEE